MLQLLHKNYSFKYPSMAVARYSFIQLSEPRQCGVNKIAKASKRQQEGSNPGLNPLVIYIYIYIYYIYIIYILYIYIYIYIYI